MLIASDATLYTCRMAALDTFRQCDEGTTCDAKDVGHVELNQTGILGTFAIAICPGICV